MNRTTRWIVFGVALAACVAVGYGAYTLAGISWDRVVSYQSPYASLDVPAATAASAEASRTVLVIIDGLRADASRKMGTLNALREHGTDLVAIAPQPSLSYPNWTTILSGAPPYVSGVVTNWHEGAAPVETLFDTADRAGVKTVFVGPEDFDALYGVKAKTAATFMRTWQKEYLTDVYVDAALDLVDSQDPGLVVIHLPDVDEAGHSYGGASTQYAETVAKTDVDLGRLVQGLQDGNTVFVVVSDHGHIDTGGHGGWEPEAVRVPVVIAGPKAKLGSGEAFVRSEGIAPTVAMLAGVAVPRNAIGEPFVDDVFRVSPSEARARALRARQVASSALVSVAASATFDAGASMATMTDDEITLAVTQAQQDRLARDRTDRIVVGIAALGACIVVLAVVGLASWRALVAAGAGALAYYALYNLLFFAVHGYRWSLSAFNSEDLIEAWMNGRLVEAAVSLLFAALVAAIVYPLLRTAPKPPRGDYLPGWLTLGPTTALVVLATLGIQVAWFVWWWGIDPVWRLPQLMWAFKYDLDLIQATAVGFSAVASPLVVYLVGRYHPKVRRHTTAEE